MIRDITLGQFYNANSSINSLDPRVKLIGALLYLIVLFMVKEFIGFAVAAMFLIIIILLSNVPFKFIFRGAKPILFILIFTFLLNLFMIKGRLLFEWGFISITYEGLHTAVFMSVRIILLVISASMMTFTTKPIALTDGIESLMNPLKRVNVPVHEIAMTLGIALRFIPTLLKETDKIIKAQESRCGGFSEGSLMDKIKGLVPVIIPLFVRSFKIAEELAMAMEARNYTGGEGRTRMNELSFGKNDYMAFLILILMSAIIIGTNYLY